MKNSKGALPNPCFQRIVSGDALRYPYRKGNSFLREMFDFESNSSHKVPQLSLVQKVVQLS